MKVVLAGAFGNLGFEILRVLIEKGHEVVAADIRERENSIRTFRFQGKTNTAAAAAKIQHMR